MAKKEKFHRLFLGVRPSRKILKDLALFQQALKQWAMDRKLSDRCRWIPVENIHLTLHFLGEREKNQTPALCDHLKTSLERKPGGTQDLYQMTFFPSFRRARVGGLAAKSPRPFLDRLQKELAHALTALGIEGESKPFIPHLSLVRFKAPVALSLSNLPTLSINFPVHSVTLFESVLGGGTSRYERVWDFTLAE